MGLLDQSLDRVCEVFLRQTEDVEERDQQLLDQMDEAFQKRHGGFKVDR